MSNRRNDYDSIDAGITAPGQEQGGMRSPSLNRTIDNARVQAPHGEELVRDRAAASTTSRTVQLRHAIDTALAKTNALENVELHVELNEGHCLLTGAVPSTQTRREVEAATLSVRGIQSCDNRLMVIESSYFP